MRHEIVLITIQPRNQRPELKHVHDRMRVDLGGGLARRLILELTSLAVPDHLGAGFWVKMFQVSWLSGS